ncbi:MAG: hypothetical protein RIQ81_12 [Pseudomonadota bacterium]
MLNFAPVAALPTGVGGTPGLGLSLGGRVAEFGGAEVLTISSTGRKLGNDTRAVSRSNTHAVLAGISSRWFYLMAGTAMVEETRTSDTTFWHSQQGGIPVMHVGFTAPYPVNESLALQLGIGRLQPLGRGASPSTTTQRYVEGTRENRPGLALNEPLKPDGSGSGASPADAAIAMKAMTTLSLGLELRL